MTVLTEKDWLELNAKLKELSNQWFQLGLALNLTPQMLMAIPTLSRNSISACLSLVLHTWLLGEDPPPTLESLAAAISDRSVGRGDLGKILLEEKEKYVQ